MLVLSPPSSNGQIAEFDFTGGTDTLTNNGTINVAAPSVSDFSDSISGVDNRGTVKVGANVTLESFTDEAGSSLNLADGVTATAIGDFGNVGGNIAATGSGQLLFDGGTFTQGAGTTSGAEPVVIDTGGNLAYSGSGASSIIVTASRAPFSGNISPRARLST